MENMDSVWKDYIATKDPALKERLIVEYAPLVKFVAGKLIIHIGQHAEFDDLISYGIFGLIDAIDRFDLSKGVKFETYASVRIRGAIIDSIRKLDWVPRTLRQKNKHVDQVFANLEASLGREPTDEDLADAMNLSVGEARELIRKSSVISLISLDDYLEQKHEPVMSDTGKVSVDGPEVQYERQELTRMLASAIEALNEKERKVVTLYYFEDLTLKEISAIMGVSESRISQIHSKAILRMQGKLGRHKAVLFSR
ncbi:MAG: FliA/WhiG family RNA polymerase sigma factor [Defluviitaleaceae bacterium]|nr:FliA/WhiG family RNA polymerase sigma factor [Defluviitaleaceae bacterium]